MKSSSSESSNVLLDPEFRDELALVLQRGREPSRAMEQVAGKWQGLWVDLKTWLKALTTHRTPREFCVERDPATSRH